MSKKKKVYRIAVGGDMYFKRWIDTDIVIGPQGLGIPPFECEHRNVTESVLDEVKDLIGRKCTVTLEEVESEGGNAETDNDIEKLRKALLKAEIQIYKFIGELETVDEIMDKYKDDLGIRNLLQERRNNHGL